MIKIRPVFFFNINFYRNFFFLGFFILFFSSIKGYAQDSNELNLDTLLKNAVVNSEKADFEEALKNYNSLLELAEEKNLIKYQILGYLNFGILYTRINEYETALYYYFKAQDIALKYHKKEYLNSIYNNIAVVYSSNNEFKKAIKAFKQSLKINQELKDNNKIAINLLNISNIYSDLGNSDLAFENAIKANKIFFDNKNYKFLSLSYCNIGDSEYNARKYSKAKENYRKSILYADTTDGYYYSICLYNLGNLFYTLNEFDSALIYLNKGLQVAGSVNNNENIIKFYTKLAELYNDHGYVNKSLQYYKKSLALKDSLFNEKSQKWISEMHMKYEFGKKEKEIEYLEERNTLNYTIWTISIFVILLITFLIVYLLRSRNIKIYQKNELLNKEQELAKLELDRFEAENIHLQEVMINNDLINRLEEEKFNERIEHQNKELALFALHLVNKNDFLNEINSNIDKIAETSNIKSNKQFIELKKLILSNIGADKAWESFKSHFEKNHINFFSNLKENFPDLSQTDLRMCSYFLINLNTHEIAQVCNISTDAVRKRKQRLKEKLSLSNETDIDILLEKYSRN